MAKKIEVQIKGISPILMHRFPLEPIEAVEKKPKEEQAEIAAYRDPDTEELFIPAVALQRALISAATYSKGKGRASLQKQTAACVFITPERLSLGTKEYVIDSRPVVVPATKGRIIRHRPRLDEWKLNFELEYDENLLTETQMRKIVDDAGQRVGLLDFNPAHKGPYGRFIVTVWNPEKELKAVS
ncbi:MAG: hypothetical protein JRK26_27300 [Deltaproteobacteria bacterium]|nr:hypothetical protein [Deltaproteobacteria bacterium]